MKYSEIIYRDLLKKLFEPLPEFEDIEMTAYYNEVYNKTKKEIFNLDVEMDEVQYNIIKSKIYSLHFQSNVIRKLLLSNPEN